jgi:hypothetical protein
MRAHNDVIAQHVRCRKKYHETTQLYNYINAVKITILKCSYNCVVVKIYFSAKFFFFKKKKQLYAFN